MVAGRGIRRLEAGFPLIDTPNTDKALRTLRRFSDIEVQVRPLEDFKAEGFESSAGFDGITEWAGDNIRVYVSKEYPESTIVHELLHVILRLQGYPTVAVDETRVTTWLPEAMRACMPVLRGRLASTVDHPEIYRRMEAEYQFDMDRYYRLQAEQEIRKLVRESLLSMEKDDCVFVQQQNVLSGLDFSLWTRPDPKLADMLMRYCPSAYNSSQALLRKVSHIGFASPADAVMSATILRDHIISYGKRRFTNKAYTVMWESLRIEAGTEAAARPAQVSECDHGRMRCF